MPPRERAAWIDHVRTFVILLVVHMHACVTYSHVGSWYFMGDREPSLPAKGPFIVWELLMQSFFMGLLFFVAGYFSHGSLSRRGTASYVRERLFRLGLPTLVYMLVIHPFILLGLNPWHEDFGPWGRFYERFLARGTWLSASGPMWFAFALLIFSLVLAGGRALRGARPPDAPAAPPSGTRILLFALALGTGSFLVRLEQPIGTDVLNMQLCFFTQYIGAFAVGLAAARGGWLQRLAESSTARRAGWLAVIAGPLAICGVLAALIGWKIGDIRAIFGGWNWPAAFLAYWEQLTGVGLSLGVMALFYRKLNRETPFLRWLADRSFAVYLLHPPVLVALTMAYRGLPQNPFGLTALLTVTGLVASFLVADLARRIPLFRNIL